MAAMSEVSRSDPDRGFERFAGTCAIVVGLGGLAYSISFVMILRGSSNRTIAGTNAVFLLLGGILTTAVFVAIYNRLRETSPSFALWALALGELGAAGAAIHGGFNLASIIHPSQGATDLPSSIDPRGLLTFGVTAIAFFVIAWLIGRGPGFPRGLGYLGYAAAILSMVLYIGRLTIVNPKNPLMLTAAVLAGFIVNPLWYAWIGVRLRKEA
ncbi:MAG: hypothetical protein WD276_11155 [Actinomycetota bacterium]